MFIFINDPNDPKGTAERAEMALRQIKIDVVQVVLWLAFLALLAFLFAMLKYFASDGQLRGGRETAASACAIGTPVMVKAQNGRLLTLCVDEVSGQVRVPVRKQTN